VLKTTDLQLHDHQETVLIYLDGQKIIFIYNELMLSLQVVHFLLQLPMSFLFIFSFMLLHDQLCLLLL